MLNFNIPNTFACVKTLYETGFLTDGSNKEFFIFVINVLYHCFNVLVMNDLMHE
jgi:hypothetical protein